MSVISNFTVDSEMASFHFRLLAEDLLVFFSNSCDSRNINCLTGEFDSIMTTSHRFKCVPQILGLLRIHEFNPLFWIHYLFLSHSIGNIFLFVCHVLASFPEGRLPY